MQNLPSHLFIGDADGALYDTRLPDWSAHPVRRNYAKQHGRITSVADFKAALRAGPYTFPGGYAVAFLSTQGGLICHDCARKHAFEIICSIDGDIRGKWHLFGQWHLCGQAVVEETYGDTCENCGQDIA